MAEGAGQFAPVSAAQGVAVVFDQPQAVLFGKSGDCIQIERIAESVGKKDRLCFR